VSNPRQQVNQSIQGLRGAAALSVMLVHVHFMAANAGLTHLVEAPWIDDIGPYAVMLFFCISRYARNRFARIYPLFLILHLIVFSVGPAMNYEWMAQLRGGCCRLGRTLLLESPFPSRSL
jgi:peptidoglycan/LPS O-acetylase OafA/YrhL